jgi:transcriptional regulator with XRE-family HTH domain
MATRKKKTSHRNEPAPTQMKGMPERLMRAMRDAEHITQKSLEEISGVSQSAISSLKNGITLDNVTCATVARLAIALNADMGWLVLGKGDVIPKLVADAKAGGVAVLDEAQSAPLVPHPPKRPSKQRKRFPRRA